MKFKKYNYKSKLAISIIMSIIFVFIIINIISTSIDKNIEQIIKEKIKKENNALVYKAYKKTRNKNNYNNLINVIKNSKEEIIEVEYNIEECTKFLNSIIDNINYELTTYNYKGYKLDIPISNKYNNLYFMNLGPKIPIKIELSDIALGNIRTEIKPFGINNAELKIFIDIYLNSSIIYPINISEERTTYSTLISNKIINGSIPNFYNGTINSKTEPINLLLNE